MVSRASIPRSTQGTQIPNCEIEQLYISSVCSYGLQEENSSNSSEFILQRLLGCLGNCEADD